MNTEVYTLKNDSLNIIAKLSVTRYKNNAIKYWDLWGYYQKNGEYKKGSFIADKNTSILVLIDLFKSYKFIKFIKG